MLTRTDDAVESPSRSAFSWPQRRPDSLPALPLRPLIAEYTATFGSTWAPVTRRKHRDDFARLVDYLEGHGLPVTTDSLDFMTLVDFVTDLRARPKVCGVWRGSPDARGRSLAAGSLETLSANSVNAYVRPLRSLAIWLVDEGILAMNPFRRSRRRASLNPLLPSEDTPTKSATLDDLQALERGCAGEEPLNLRDRAIVSILDSDVSHALVDDDSLKVALRRAFPGRPHPPLFHEVPVHEHMNVCPASGSPTATWFEERLAALVRRP